MFFTSKVVPCRHPSPEVQTRYEPIAAIRFRTDRVSALQLSSVRRSFRASARRVGRLRLDGGVVDDAAGSVGRDFAAAVDGVPGSRTDVHDAHRGPLWTEYLFLDHGNGSDRVRDSASRSGQTGCLMVPVPANPERQHQPARLRVHAGDVHRLDVYIRRRHGGHDDAGGDLAGFLRPDDCRHVAFAEEPVGGLHGARLSLRLSLAASSRSWGRPTTP
jgi:hypothetical protein